MELFGWRGAGADEVVHGKCGDITTIVVGGVAVQFVDANISAFEIYEVFVLSLVNSLWNWLRRLQNTSINLSRDIQTPNSCK